MKPKSQLLKESALQTESSSSTKTSNCATSTSKWVFYKDLALDTNHQSIILPGNMTSVAIVTALAASILLMSSQGCTHPQWPNFRTIQTAILTSVGTFPQCASANAGLVDTLQAQVQAIQSTRDKIKHQYREAKFVAGLFGHSPKSKVAGLAPLQRKSKGAKSRMTSANTS